jgi:hypothetical protein
MTIGKAENPYNFTPQSFAPRDLIELSREAHLGARDFIRELGRFDSGAQWVAGFLWHSKRSMRANKNSEWIDEGPGIDLAGYRVNELPENTIETRDGLPVAFVIPRDIVDSSAAKRIAQVRVSSGRMSFQIK